jgi:L,D-transpeptidase ErfK/SrfK
MQALFDRTREGTPLALIYQPYKWGIDGERLYLEVHPDLYDRLPDRLAAALAVPRALGLLGDVRLDAVWRAVDEAKGVPVWVGSVTPSRARELAGDPP